MRDRAEHAAHGRAVAEDHRGADLLEAEALECLPLPRARADRALFEDDLDHPLLHPPPPPPGAPAGLLPRAPATASGGFSMRSAAIVARTMLCGLFDPRH